MLARYALVLLMTIGLIGCTSSASKLEKAETKITKEEQKQQSGFLRKLSGGKPNPGGCPGAGILYEGSRIVNFEGDQIRYANVGFTGEIESVRAYCRYWDDLPIEVEVELNFAFGKGPAATDNQHEYKYFVAVIRRNSVLLKREIFALPVTFKKGDDRTYAKQRIERISIPRRSADVAGENFEILVGFELTPKQIAFNRSGQRFRVNVAERVGTTSNDKSGPDKP